MSSEIFAQRRRDVLAVLTAAAYSADDRQVFAEFVAPMERADLELVLYNVASSYLRLMEIHGVENVQETLAAVGLAFGVDDG